VGFGISNIEPTGFITRVSVHVEFNRTGGGSEKQIGNDCRQIISLQNVTPNSSAISNLHAKYVIYILSAIHHCALTEIMSLCFFNHLTAIYFAKTHTCMQNAVQIAYNMKLMVQKTYYEKKGNKCYKTDI